MKNPHPAEVINRPTLDRGGRHLFRGKDGEDIVRLRQDGLSIQAISNLTGFDRELNSELRRWLAEVANQRIHGSTHQSVQSRWPEELAAMTAINGRLSFPYAEDEPRRVARDAYVTW